MYKNLSSPIPHSQLSTPSLSVECIPKNSFARDNTHISKEEKFTNAKKHNLDSYSLQKAECNFS
jgi:hypothetical protein